MLYGCQWPERVSDYLRPQHVAMLKNKAQSMSLAKLVPQARPGAMARPRLAKDLKHGLARLNKSLDVYIEHFEADM